MVINENNSYINTFTAGMNSDSAYDQLDNKHYVYGKNIRITKNLLLGGYNDYATQHEGIVTPVLNGILINEDNIGIDGDILAVDSVDRLCTIVTKHNKGISVYRVFIDEENNSVFPAELLWQADNIWDDANNIPDKLSTVLYKELENVVKLYIATGEVPLIILRVDEETNLQLGTPLDCVINNRIVPENRVYIDEVISGRLKTQQVLYTYRLYNKYANTTQLAPLTNKIQVIDGSRSKENGNAEDTETSLGFKLVIKKDNNYWDYFKRILVYRLSYIKPEEPAEVSLIYDDKLPEDNLIINDVGIEPLQTLTIEEFAAMSGLILVPQVVELNLNYMFCGNVKDDTIIKDIEFVDAENPFDEVKADVVISDGYNGIIPQKTSDKFIDTNTFSYNKYFESHDINPELALSSYDNIITSSLLRSLRRGEQYKYAIILYDKYGRRTDVHKLGEIEVHEINLLNNMPFSIEGDKVIAHPIGVKITLPKINFEDKKDIIGCLIVRRSSSEIYLRTLLQVALAKPVNQGLLLTTQRETPEEPTKYSPYYPTGFLGVNDLTISPTYYWELLAIEGIGIWGVTKNGQMYAGDNFTDYWARMRADNLFLIFSSEIDYRRDDVLSRLSTSGMKMSEVYYIPALYKLHGGSEELDTFYGLYGEEGQHDVVTEEYEIVDNISYSSTLVNDSLAYYTVKTSQLLRGDDIKIITLLNGNNTEPALGWTLGVYAGQFDGNVEHLGTKMCDILTSRGNNMLLDSTFMDALRSNEYITLTSNRGTGAYEIQFILYRQKQNEESSLEEQTDGLYIKRYFTKRLSTDEKTNEYWVFNYFKMLDDIDKRRSNFGSVGPHDIKYIKDVKIPNWEDGFSNIQRDSDLIILTAIKQYKQFTTGIDQYTYNNWCSFGKYDLRAGVEPLPNVATEGNLNLAAEFISTTANYKEWLNDSNDKREAPVRYGYIGPGGSCFLLTTENKNPGEFQTYTDTFYTSICNIKHNPKLDDVESDEVTQYFGFGNYFKVKVNDDGSILTADDKNFVIVFDGDVYITPHEFTTMYKTYNFESVDTLQSTQITSYVPLESKVNTFFDYGMNLRNTTSANMMYEPGSIDGVATQDRPVHQYNMIYSDNDTSNDVFTLISTDKNETNLFKQRAYFSEPKTNGEFIDNFLIFKAASFIDVDSQYGLLTNMDTDKNNLYYWQDHAFGKFSVNERSLINDTNGNTIMLGQAGILSRYDYLSTKFGMRLYDFCSRTTENGLFWVDINNKAVVGSAHNGVVNYGEQLFVQNLINNSISDDVPYVDYDIQNNELLCKCLNDGEQIVFNTKYNVATSIYNRQYDNIAYIKNHLFGIYNKNVYRFNYTLKDQEEPTFLTPIALHFVVNPNTSITKVFDSQQIVPIKRNAYLPDIVNNTNMKFETDLYNATWADMNEVYTDREGNIIYNIPRFGQEEYGNRLRGKWMKVEMTNNNQSQYTSISHVITKFRQSFS